MLSRVTLLLNMLASSKIFWNYFCTVAAAEIDAGAMKSQAEDHPGAAIPSNAVPSKVYHTDGVVKSEDRPGVAVPHNIVSSKVHDHPGGAVKSEDHPGVATPHTVMPSKLRDRPGGAAVVNMTPFHRPLKSNTSVKAQPSLIQGLTLSYHQLTCSVMMGRKCHEWRKQILHKLRY